MKVLITGARGLVGKAIIPALQECGHEIVGYDLLDGNDIFDAERLGQAMASCNAVIHLAAIPWPDPQMPWRAFWELNCLGVQRVAEMAEMVGIRRVIFTSSTAYYGAEQGIDWRWPVDETSPPAVQALDANVLHKATPAQISYMQSKVIAENILLAYGLRGAFDLVIFRLTPMRPDRNRPYEGLWMGGLARVGRAMAWALDAPGPIQEIVCLADPDCERVNTGKWQSLGREVGIEP